MFHVRFASEERSLETYNLDTKSLKFVIFRSSAKNQVGSGTAQLDEE